MIYGDRPVMGDRPLLADRPVHGGRPVVDRRAPIDAENLSDYQIEGARWLRERRAALLADEMGLGKTAQALRGLPALAPTIVVCPASVRAVWRDEARKWRRDLKPITRPAGIFQVPNEGEMSIVSFESLPELPARKSQRWLVSDPRVRLCYCIVDEAHYAKNPRADRSQKVRLLGNQCRACWLLTGTPLLGKPDDLAGLLEAGGLFWTFSPEHWETQEHWGAREHFVRLFGGKKRRKAGIVYPAEPPGAKEIRERLGRVMLRRERHQVAKDLPPITVQDIPVELGDEGDEALVRELDALETELSKLPDELPPFEKISAVRAELALRKVGAAVAAAESYEAEGRPVVAFSAHRAPVEALARREGWEPITGEQSERERAESVRKFQAGELKGLACTIQAGGVGITLTKAADVLMVDLSYTPAENDQAIARVVRRGQTARRVLVKRLVTDHALERRLYAILDEKGSRIAATVRPTSKKAPERS